MPYFVISNFASGQDLRRSVETAPSGSLRVLRNAFINEGGEIEKRKAFVMQEDLTDYAQNGEFKGRITGPHPCPESSNTVYFRHRSAAVPGAPFADNGGDAVFVDDVNAITGRLQQRYWVYPSTQTLAADQAMFHAASQSLYSSTSYVVESHVESANLDRLFQHVITTFNGDEPISEALVADNDDRPYQRVLDNKGYVVAGKTVYSSALGDLSDMAGTGSWSNDLTTQGTPIGNTISLAEYFGQLVIFGERGMMFFQVDPDPELNQYLRTVPGSVFGPRATVGYSDGDVLFLSRSGIRSLQSRDSSNLARVSDVGSPIDSLVRSEVALDANDTDVLFGQIEPPVVNDLFYDLATGIVHQDSGQAWMSLRDNIYVLSRYPSAKVLAWSTFDTPPTTKETQNAGGNKAAWVADWCQINETVVLRNFADEVYIYGGSSGDEYDATEVEIIMPYMDMGRPGTTKKFTGVDVICDGEWLVEYATDHFGPDITTRWAPIAHLDGSTRSGPKVSFPASGTQIALRLTCTNEFAAKISEVIVYYKDGSEK